MPYLLSSDSVLVSLLLCYYVMVIMISNDISRICMSISINTSTSTSIANTSSSSSILTSTCIIILLIGVPGAVLAT